MNEVLGKFIVQVFLMKIMKNLQNLKNFKYLKIQILTQDIIYSLMICLI
jgi:hypothetical protein